VTLEAWLGQRTANAPPALRARVWQHAGATAEGSLPVRLVAAGRAALDQVVAHAGDRSVALDLLAADALITLALLAQAEGAPEQLGAFAATLLQDDRPPT
jgi:hypothetical protein